MKALLSYLTLTVAVTLLSSCGRPIEQDRVALVVKNFGARSADKPKISTVWAARCDWDPSGQSQQIYEFPLGLQTYEMTSRTSYESRLDESFQLDCVGGRVKADVMVQLYLDRTVPNLEEKLFAFLNDHQLRQYAGSRNMLAQWAQTKLRNIIRQPFAQYVLDKQMVEVMREKQKINELLLKAMNERFSKYGVVFTAVAISSPIDPVSSQSREGLAKVVHAEYQQKLLTRQKEGLTPLTMKVMNKKQEGITAVEKAMSTARGEAATIVANAQQKRATDVTATIGKENYAKLEALVRLSDGLKEGNVPVNIMPSSLTAIFGSGQAAAALPPSKK